MLAPIAGPGRFVRLIRIMRLLRLLRVMRLSKIAYATSDNVVGQVPPALRLNPDPDPNPDICQPQGRRSGTAQTSSAATASAG